jgi:hypothetical protein
MGIPNLGHVILVNLRYHAALQRTKCAQSLEAAMHLRQHWLIFVVAESPDDTRPGIPFVP